MKLINLRFWCYISPHNKNIRTTNNVLTWWHFCVCVCLNGNMLLSVVLWGRCWSMMKNLPQYFDISKQIVITIIFVIYSWKKIEEMYCPFEGYRCHRSVKENVDTQIKMYQKVQTHNETFQLRSFWILIRFCLI